MIGTIESIALAETWQLSVPTSEHRKKLRAQADELEQALHRTTAQFVGAFVAQFDHMALSEPRSFAQHQLEVEYLDDTEFELALKQQISADKVLIGAGAKMDAGSVADEQLAYGSVLVRGLLHQYGKQLNAIIATGLKEGLTREQLRQRLLDQATPKMSKLMPEWRARLIAQTEAIRSWNAVSFQALREATQEYVRWIDGQPGACPDCAGMDGRIIPLPAGTNKLGFVSHVRGLVAQFPPLHPGCRCAIGGADAKEFQQQPQPGANDYYDLDIGIVKPLYPLVLESLKLPKVQDGKNDSSAAPPFKIMTVNGIQMDAQSAIDDIMAKAPKYKLIKSLLEEWASNHGLDKNELMDALKLSTGKSVYDLFGAHIGKGVVAKKAPPVVAKKTPPGVAKVKPSTPHEYKAGFEQPAWAKHPDSYWDDAVQTGPQGGSNFGGKFTAKDGKSYYLKQYDDILQAHGEVAAAGVYKMLGVQTAKSAVITRKGKKWFASEWDDAATTATQTELQEYLKKHPKEAANLFISSVFTQNWDVVGLKYDNIVFTKKGLKVVDTGGSWTHKAMGGAKPYDPLANEFKNFLNPNVNAQSASVFKDVWTNPEALAQARQAAAWLRSNVDTIWQALPRDTRALVTKASLLAKLDDMDLRLDQLGATKNKMALTHTSADDIAVLKRFKAKVEQNIIAHFGTVSGKNKDQIIDAWKGSSSEDLSMALKARVGEIIHGISFADAYIVELKRYHGPKYDDAMDAANKEKAAELEKLVSPAVAARIYASSQKSLATKYAGLISSQGTVTVYRGIHGYTEGGKEAVKAVWDAIENGGQPVWNANWAQSFSLNRDVTYGFVGAQIGMVIQLEVPAESVLMTPDILLAREQEVVVLGPLGGYQLPPGSIPTIKWEGKSRSYGEQEFDFARDGFFASFTTANQEDEWCKWLRE